MSYVAVGLTAGDAGQHRPSRRGAELLLRCLDDQGFHLLVADRGRRAQQTGVSRTSSPNTIVTAGRPIWVNTRPQQQPQSPPCLSAIPASLARPRLKTLGPVHIERLFGRLKRFRRIATRYDKLDVIFLSGIYLALIYDLLPSM